MREYTLSPPASRQAEREAPAAAAAPGLSMVHTATFLQTGHLIELTEPLFENPVCSPKGGKREKVKGMSKQSRLRMLRFIAKLGDAIPDFCTLTFSDEYWPEDGEELKKILDKFWKMVQRRYPDLGCLWKVEVERRKSGTRIGELAPHFHLLIYRSDGELPSLARQEHRDWFSLQWAKASGDMSQKHIEAGVSLESARSHRGAMCYVAKYTAKPTEMVEEWNLGKVWGKRSEDNLPIKEEEELDEVRDYEREAFFELQLESQAQAVASKRAWKEFPQLYSQRQLRSYNRWERAFAEEENKIQEEGRAYYRDCIYYKEAVEELRANPHRVSRWRIMDDFDEWRAKTSLRHIREYEFVRAYYFGELPEVWYEKLNLPRDPLSNLSELDRSQVLFDLKQFYEGRPLIPEFEVDDPEGTEEEALVSGNKKIAPET